MTDRTTIFARVLLGSLALFGSMTAWAGDHPRCRNYDRLKQPFFGEMHSHSTYSQDAATLDTRNTPEDSYRFAKGEKVGLPPFVDTRYDTTVPAPAGPDQPVSDHPYCFPGERCQYTATRVAQLPKGRALDFAALTDHSEWLGENNICFWENNVACSDSAPCSEAGQKCLNGSCVPVGYDSPSCVLARQEITRLRNGAAVPLFAAPYITPESPTRLPFCGPDGVNCLFQARNVWQRIVADAEDAYDRTNECRFTSFVGYEYTATPSMGQCSVDANPCWSSVDCNDGQSCNAAAPGGNNLHRNVIFRDQNVPPRPISNIEAPIGCGSGDSCLNGKNTSPGPIGSPFKLLSMLKKECRAIPGCDVISIPHNSNMGDDAMFRAPENAEEARLRREMEPLVEVYQIKGQSECRYSSSKPGAWGTRDPLCDFETIHFGRLNGNYLPDPTAKDIPPLNFVRNALKEGLQYADSHSGMNPFEFGFIGATDNHDGTPGQTDSEVYAKNGAHGVESFTEPGGALNEASFLGLDANPGGLTVAWAEENTREALFSAFKRRETYATSGTRPVVRFFGGFDIKKNMCKSGDFAKRGYAGGVPMGGCLRGGRGNSEGCKSASDSRQSLRFAVLASMDPGFENHPGTPLQKVQIIKGWVDSNGRSREKVYDVAGDSESRASVDPRTCETHGKGFESLCSVWEDPDFDPEQRAFYYARVIENPTCRWNQIYCNSRHVDCSKRPDSSDPSSPYTEWDFNQCCSGYAPLTAQQRAATSPIWYSP